ncbi:tryptophan--tRNA ligase [Clostridiales bacterium COT073_COT-073]|nr:tryptophan--tRNA ligase [Clostridiales bacterium COT073_COT-073]
MENQEKKPVIYSGIQPTGVITIGNYFGAVKNWTQLPEQYDCYYSIVDLHSITVRQEPKKLRENTKNLLAFYIAAGLDPKQNILYLQSSVRQHAELAWILNCFTYMGELSRMTQFKDKSQKHGENINAGLFTYPVLMAADILLYQTDLVPIGDDQKQHLELARDIAIRLNNEYSGLFKVPEAYYGKVGARIKSLQEPEKKMSKSDENVNAFISVLDEPAQIRNKIKRAVTDSLGEVNYTDDQPGVKNLLDIYICSTKETKEQALEKFAGQGYGYLKEETANALIAELEPIQKEFARIVADKAYLEEILKENGQKAAYNAEKTLRKVKKKVGFLEI